MSKCEEITFTLDSCAGGREMEQSPAACAIPRVARLMALAIRLEDSFEREPSKTMRRRRDVGG